MRPLYPREPGNVRGRGAGRATHQEAIRGRLGAVTANAAVSDAPEPLVIFTPSGRRGRVPSGATVLDAARAPGVDVDSVCGGRGICGRCQVTPGVGSFPKHGITSSRDHLGEAGE